MHGGAGIYLPQPPWVTLPEHYHRGGKLKVLDNRMKETMTEVRLAGARNGASVSKSCGGFFPS